MGEIGVRDLLWTVLNKFSKQLKFESEGDIEDGDINMLT